MLDQNRGQLVCLFVIVHTLCISSPPLAITVLVLAIFIAIPGGNQEIEIGSMQIERALKKQIFYGPFDRRLFKM